jgi:uncharacterized protein YeaO (DUF488 family)
MGDIRVRRVYDLPGAEDGARVLADRLWPRGMRKEAADLTLWLKEIAPSDELRRWYHRDMTQWQEFARRYRAELDRSEAAVKRLLGLIRSGTVTLLYAAREAEHNHAIVLAEYMRERLRLDKSPTESRD